MTKAESALSTIPAIRLRLLPALLAAAGLLAATQVAAQRLPTPLAAPAKVSVFEAICKMAAAVAALWVANCG